MYDDDSEGEDGKVGRKVANSVKRVARGTRRMSLMAADNVKNVAQSGQRVVKKIEEKVGVDTGKKKKKKKKKKKDKKEKKEKKKKEKKEKKKKRGRSESPRRSTNAEGSKPPVTSGWKGLISKAKRWRSASPLVGKSKKSRAGTVQSEEELEPLAPLPTFQSYGGGGMGTPGTDPSYDGMGMSGMSSSMQHHTHMSVGGGSAQYHQSRDVKSDAIGTSLRSMSSTARYQRNQAQERIEKENAVPFFTKLLQSKQFVKYVDLAFDMVDSNHDEAVDETELYAGLLLIHLKLGSFLGPAGCKPLSRARCNAMFQRFDSTGSGGLDRTEFRRVMMVLFGNIFARVCVQYTLTIIFVPLIAKRVLDFLTWDSQGFWDYWTKPKSLRRMGAEFTLHYFVDWNVTSFPSTRRTFFTKMYSLFRFGSDEFWNTFPLTFMTILLGLVIAPLVLFYVDDGFQYAVDWKEKRDKDTAKKKR